MRNPFRREIDRRVEEAMLGLSREVRSRAALDYLKAMRVYAAFGRDRRKLGMGWVREGRRRIRELNERGW